MPLHKIPLCGFSYAGDTLSGATFEYDVREKITKDKTRLFYKKNLIEIEKNHSKMFYKNNIYIEDFKNEKLLYEDNKDICKTKIKTIKKYDININLKSSNTLNKEEINITKNIEFNLRSDDPQLYKVINMQLKDTSRNKNIVIKTSKEFEQFKTNIEMNKNAYINLIRNNILKFNINNKNKYINRVVKKELVVNILKKLERFISLKGVEKNNSIFLKKVNCKKINNYKGKFIDREIIKQADIVGPIYCFDIMQQYNIFKINSKHIYRDNFKGLIKIQNRILAYKDGRKDIYKTKQFNSLHKDVLKNIYKIKYQKLVYKDFKKSIFVSSIQLLDKDGTEYIFKIRERYLKRVVITEIFKDKFIKLNRGKNIDISKCSIEAVKNISFKNIFKDNFIGMIKDECVHILKYEQYKVSKGFIDIIKNIYNTADLEVIKRWWVLGVTKPTDQKILPMDYNYLNNPLLINRRNLKYGCLTNQDKHPISFMPYLEGNMGIDLSYGLNEINVSIEIMIDMVNIVSMIVQHSSSQFVNCSGQEVIEFIMELLIDWLNMDSIIHEMQLKGSREHYLRGYRWIRWEAEKVWFAADEDHTQDKMMGIKYAGMLFANLLDYMKYHHFNVVPLWRNLKYMDVERQFNKIATNGDITKELDKLKSKRHYSIETQNSQRKIGGN